jgi:hypothetical protein
VTDPIAEDLKTRAARIGWLLVQDENDPTQFTLYTPMGSGDAAAMRDFMRGVEERRGLAGGGVEPPTSRL